ncbi:hypothetical protein C5167_045507 [Papaver somniferum]|uniref:Uncharacterized protein n=1 Tax=Papaver somniferum TaxID=3469 RepID=A0A4Y7LDL8_PAPSO|nr:hypothetical protein C5167_045507 [Papaver somniferum]
MFLAMCRNGRFDLHVYEEYKEPWLNYSLPTREYKHHWITFLELPATGTAYATSINHLDDYYSFQPSGGDGTKANLIVAAATRACMHCHNDTSHGHGHLDTPKSNVKVVLILEEPETGKNPDSVVVSIKSLMHWQRPS